MANGIPLAHLFMAKYNQTPVKNLENIHVMLRRIRDRSPCLIDLFLEKSDSGNKRISNYIFPDFSTLEITEIFKDKTSSFLSFKVKG